MKNRTVTPTLSFLKLITGECKLGFTACQAPGNPWLLVHNPDYDEFNFQLLQTCQGGGITMRETFPLRPS